MIVYDLDGTLRDTTPADNYVPEDPSKQENWIPWQVAVNELGTPIADVVEEYKEACAGREEVRIVTSSSFGTQAWLEKHNLPQPSEIHERRDGNNERPMNLKKHFLAIWGNEITQWIDDSEEVCDFVRDYHSSIEVVKVTPPNEKGMKFDDEKPRYDLLPPYAIDTMCKVLTFGAKKYSPDNWKKVERVRYIAAAMRHMFALLRGETYDSETGLHHGAHAMCCLSFIVEKDETKKLE